MRLDASVGGSLEQVRASNFHSQRVFSNPRGKEKFLKSLFLSLPHLSRLGGSSKS